MQFLLDNLTASIIAATMFMMMLSVNVRTQQSLTETTAFYAVTAQTESFTQILRRDMQGIVEILDNANGLEGDTTHAFSFRGTIGNDLNEYIITYTPEHIKTRTTIIESDYQKRDTLTTSFYRIKRTVDGAEAGGSGDILTNWEMKCRNASGQYTTDPDVCAQVEVVLEAASPLGDMMTVTRLNWGSVFHPEVLQEKNQSS